MTMTRVIGWLRRVQTKSAPVLAVFGFGGLAVCLLTLLVFGWLAQEVLEKEAFGFDTQFLLWIHQWANPILDALMLHITTLADPEFVVVIVAIAGSILWWNRRWIELRTFAIVCLGGFVLNTGLKLVFAKSRPHLWTPLIHETSYSFPSGHALGAAVVYGFLAFLLARRYRGSKRWIYASTAVLVSAIGLSRLYLGVHWLTDIIAGYSVGLLWLMIGIAIFHLQLPKSSALD